MLIQSFADLFDLFRAVMQVQHASLLETVPSLGMQFANDCDWLAKEVGGMNMLWPTETQESSDVVARTSEGLSSLGVATRENQMVRRAGALCA